MLLFYLLIESIITLLVFSDAFLPKMISMSMEYFIIS